MASETTELTAVILAAGEGTRMASARPKPLHEVGGRSLLAHAMASAASARPSRVAVVVGAGGDAVAAAAAAIAPEAEIAEQKERLGTAHAVLAARATLAASSGDAVVLYADTPFIEADTLAAMRAKRAEGADVVVLGFRAADPSGYGRLMTEGGRLLAIVEERDADAATRAVDFCNSGVVMADAATLISLLDEVGCDNAKGEYYLTDVVSLAARRKLVAAAVECDEAETLGVNSRADLAAAEAAFQARAREAAMAGGATLVDPATVWFSHDTALGRDVLVEPNVVFGPGVTVEPGATIRAMSHLEGATVRGGAVIGPFARLRPGAEIGADARIGNFVEVKNAALGPGAKANHLAYIGDADVGAEANVGAGAITCNYDGVMKHRTVVGA
ncbi:MAG: bifunctional UDP-N-acetylglucosamine diphosphorylase/glucosamine-1-phosphate N-acetyltransferase GlmU, partial [Pseudomonadota bacterium]